MTTAAPLIPPGADLDELRERAGTCTACDLYANATQTVFGVGPTAASLMLVGEQPGDQEDRRGRPFVGPAGALLDAEIEAVSPRVVVVCLGATAAPALLGPQFEVTEQRGVFVEWSRPVLALATVHPSSILRAGDDDARRAQRAAFVADLETAARALD